MSHWKHIRIFIFLFLGMAWGIHGEAQLDDLQKNNLVWTSQSKNSGESMPCGGGDIGLNVWVENGELFFYASRSGTFDEHNTLLKMGRVRMKFTPNPYSYPASARQR